MDFGASFFIVLLGLAVAIVLGTAWAGIEHLARKGKRGE